MYMNETGQTICIGNPSNQMDSWMEMLSQYGATTNLYLCPTTQTNTQESPDDSFPGTASLAWYWWPPTTASPVNGSYSINGWLVSFEDTNVGTWDFTAPTLVTTYPQFLFNKPTWVQTPAQTPIFNDAAWMNEWPMEFDMPAPDLSKGEVNNILGMQRSTIWRHGGKTATSPVMVVYSFPPSLLPKDAAINIGFDDGHTRMVKLNDLWSLYWHKNWKPSPTPP